MTQTAKFSYDAQILFWIETSAKLKEAADVLWNHVTDMGEKQYHFRVQDEYAGISSKPTAIQVLSNPYMMLAGLSIENLLKAICILNDPELVDEEKGTLNKKGILKHDLVSLWEQAGLDIRDAEFIGSDFLNRLTAFIEWAGKYPVARIAADHRPPIVDTGDPERFQQVYGKAMDHLKACAERKHGIVSLIPVTKDNEDEGPSTD